MKHLFALLAMALALSAGTLCAQFKMETPTGEAPGPWIFGTIGVGRNEDKSIKTTALKGLAIKLGGKGEAAIAYDLDLCRVAGAWTGKFTTPMNLMSRGEYPTALGNVAFTTAAVPGMAHSGASADALKDPRPRPFGPLPEVRFRGVHLHGQQVVIVWGVGETPVLELPGYKADNRGGVFTRTFHVPAREEPLLISLASNPDLAEGAPIDQTIFRLLQLDDPALPERLIQTTPWARAEKGEMMLWATGAPLDATWRNVAGQLCIEIPARDEPVTFQIAYWVAPAADPEGMNSPLSPNFEEIDLPAMTKGAEPLWPETVETEGELSTSTEPYVVDTIKLPETNPWNAPVSTGGFDFFEDGGAALCTFHGDVFIASGIDEKLGKITWRRFAAGLYHPLGLKIVKGDVYVTCRDGIYRLRDLNNDGQADFYEVFNYDLMVTKNFHEFVFDLHADSDGAFYFAKAGPVKNGGRGFDEIVPHHGCVFRVSPDGRKLEVIATGFRAPNGIGLGPHGELTSGDNEGTWMPMCKINWINPGGFYGVVDLAHRDEPPTDYDRPLCWLPKRVDNSGGSQVWVTSNKWGPWRGRMLHLSYGTASLFGVLHEGVNVPDAPSCCSYVVQGGVTRFPVQFQSGAMRGRFHPKDGQLYVVGLRGWQTSGLKNGAFQRVRYTGAPVQMPIELFARKDGIEIRFTSSIDTQAAADPENWNIEVWDYIWSAAYGSPEVSTVEPGAKPLEVGKDGKPEYSPAQMKRGKRDPLEVKSVSVGTDDRSVFLEIPGIKRVMQMQIRYQIRSADGSDLKGEILNTINALGEATP